MQLKDFDEKVVSKMCVLVEKFGPNEALTMLERIEEVLKGKVGRAEHARCTAQRMSPK